MPLLASSWSWPNSVGKRPPGEAQINLNGQNVPLSALYAECERLTGDASCWGVVQTMQLKARAQEGVQPNQ